MLPGYLYVLLTCPNHRGFTHTHHRGVCEYFLLSRVRGVSHACLCLLSRVRGVSHSCRCLCGTTLARFNLGTSAALALIAGVRATSGSGTSSSSAQLMMQVMAAFSPRGCNPITLHSAELSIEMSRGLRHFRGSFARSVCTNKAVYQVCSSLDTTQACCRLT